MVTNLVAIMVVLSFFACHFTAYTGTSQLAVEGALQCMRTVSGRRRGRQQHCNGGAESSTRLKCPLPVPLEPRSECYFSRFQQERENLAEYSGSVKRSHTGGSRSYGMAKYSNPIAENLTGTAGCGPACQVGCGCAVENRLRRFRKNRLRSSPTIHGALKCVGGQKVTGNQPLPAGTCSHTGERSPRTNPPRKRC